MGNINVPWEVEGVITVEQSVVAMIDVIQSKGIQHSGTFWTWENRVGDPSIENDKLLTLSQNSRILGNCSLPANGLHIVTCLGTMKVANLEFIVHWLVSVRNETMGWDKRNKH